MALATEVAAELLDADEEVARRVIANLSPEQVIELSRYMADPDLREWLRSSRWKHDPAGWAEKTVGVELYSVQRRIVESVRDHRYTAVPSAFGVGKSMVAGRVLIPWWISVHAPGTAMVLSSAPTMDQVRGILWKEVNLAHSAGHLIGRVNLAQWYIGNLLVGMGRKPSNTNPAALQGIHAQFLLVIIDEADGVSPQLWEAVDALVTNEDARVLAIGNPLTGSGPFYRACQAGSRWNVIRVSAFDTPDFTGEPVPRNSALTSRTWVKERQDEYGPNYAQDPRYQARVLAVPPENRSQGVIRLSSLRGAARAFEEKGEQERWWEEALTHPATVGIDIGASEGGDQTVARERRGDVLGRVRRWRIRDHVELAEGHVIPFLVETEAKRVVVDKAGVGHGLADALDAAHRRGYHDARVVRFDAGASGRKKTASHPGFPKQRDQLWWEVGRNLLDKGSVDMRILSTEQDGEKVMVELAEHEWHTDDAGRIKIEPKDDIRERLGHSPDDADAVLLAFYEPSNIVTPALPRSSDRANPYRAGVAG